MGANIFFSFSCLCQCVVCRPFDQKSTHLFERCNGGVALTGSTQKRNGLQRREGGQARRHVHVHAGVLLSSLPVYSRPRVLGSLFSVFSLFRLCKSTRRATTTTVDLLNAHVYSLYTFLATDKTTFLHFLLIFTTFYFIF
jgi:hypothetical protein